GCPAQAGHYPRLHAGAIDQRGRRRHQQAGRPGPGAGRPRLSAALLRRSLPAIRPICAALPPPLWPPPARFGTVGPPVHGCPCAMTDTPFELTDELRLAIYQFFERIPFNRLLGIEIGELSEERVTMHL